MNPHPLRIMRVYLRVCAYKYVCKCISLIRQTKQRPFSIHVCIGRELCQCRYAWITNAAVATAIATAIATATTIHIKRKTDIRRSTSTSHFEWFFNGPFQ